MILINYNYQILMTWKRFLVDLTKIAASPTTYDRGKDWAHWDGKRWHFDCCRSIKAELWGFCFDKLRNHGGAVCGRGYPDYTTEEMIATCYDVSTDMRKDAIAPGELLWFKGHVGVYMGGGNVFECCPSKKGCAITSITYQRWEKHGKLPVIKYDDQPAPAPVDPVLEKGQFLELKDEPLYKSSTAKTAVRKYTGPAWLVDGKLFVNDRVRVTFDKKNVGNVSMTDGYITWRWAK